MGDSPTAPIAPAAPTASAAQHDSLTAEDYQTLYARSLHAPQEFWSEQAEKFITWFQPWTKVFSGGFAKLDMAWFTQGKLNATYNCLDRHLETRGEQTAIIWEGDDPTLQQKISYKQLHEKVCRLANVLKKRGIKKGDKVCIYMPMVPEAVIAMLACARIGAVHSVVFGGFSAESLQSRILDADCRLVITANEGLRNNKSIPLKDNVDIALKNCPRVRTVIVVERTKKKTHLEQHRDIWYHEALQTVTAHCAAEIMDASDPLFILYTSGSTGKPKGILHTTGGYMVYVAMTHQYIFNYQPGDVYWCTADVGWITGHSYGVYGPLANGATTLIFEGVPQYPTFARYWEVIDKHQVNIFYTAPTAIRALRREGDAWVTRTQRKSLKLLGTVGEPINPDVWQWYYDVVGEQRCPIVDTWWQTETGGILISPLPGSTTLKPGSVAWPFFGIVPEIVDDQGQAVADNTLGKLIIKQPWPGMMQTVYGDRERFVENYFKEFPGYYSTGDNAKRDAEGYFWITGRNDDVIKVSGHRIGTGEVESALLTHPAVSEAAVVAVPNDITGNSIYAFITLKAEQKPSAALEKELASTVRQHIGAIVKIDYIQWSDGLPKTRSGKIMRRLLRKIANNDVEDLGDISTLADPEVVTALVEKRLLRADKPAPQKNNLSHKEHTMAMNVTQKLIQSHLLEGQMIPGQEIALKIDQTLCQDATGTLVMLELEAMNLERVKTEISAQYVDHNLIQEDYKNADDHLFLQSAAERFGVWYSRPGNGVSHPVHMENFGIPGKTLVGSDSHTCAAGSMGMLAMGAGGLEVAMAMAGEPFYVKMPKVFGVKLSGKFPDWVSAKDIILEMLRRHDVKGGVDCVIEYWGPALKHLTAMDRHVIANMGAELGATATVFPSDKQTLKFLQTEGREADWYELSADKGAKYDLHDHIDLAKLEPLIALPSSPGKVVPVREVEGKDIYQAYIGSSANPGFRDFAMSAMMVKGRNVPSNVSFDVNPTSRDQLEELARSGMLADLVHAGARIHQAGCNGCIGMGQAPATGKNSLRTVPRNFPGRSGTLEDSVFLCSPETATASALRGAITDPRDMDFPYPKVKLPKKMVVNKKMLQPPLPLDQARKVQLVKGPNIASIPPLNPLPENFKLSVLLKVGDNISTDEILPAGARVLPYRSNIPKISEFLFDIIDDTYAQRAKAQHSGGGHAIIAGENYGQGSSREHAALAPRYLGLHLVIAKSFARIHWQNLINFGILPLTFVVKSDYQKVNPDDIILIERVPETLKKSNELTATLAGTQTSIKLQHKLSPRQIDILIKGGLINWIKTP